MPRVQAMAELTAARVFRFGMTPAADLWADEVESAGMEGIRFRFHYRPLGQKKVESLVVRVPLLGRHSVQTALCATAAGLVEGLGWDDIVAGLQNVPGQLRLVIAPCINGATVIDDTYNASPASTIAALNLLADVAPKGQRAPNCGIGRHARAGQLYRRGPQAGGPSGRGCRGRLGDRGRIGRCDCRRKQRKCVSIRRGCMSCPGLRRRSPCSDR